MVTQLVPSKYTRAQAYSREGRWDEAEPLLRQLVAASDSAIPAYWLSQPDLNPTEELSALSGLAREHLRLGDVDAAVRLIDQAWALVLAESRARGPEVQLLLAQTAELRAIVYLRLAEVRNCIARHNPECCVFPLSGGGVHSDREPALQALAMLAPLLERSQARDLRLRWLANVLGMAAGLYPSGMPAAVVIPPERFASEHDIGRFPDIAPSVGLDVFSQCGGCIVEDFDGDGLLDVVTSNFDPAGPLTYHRNDGRGGFQDQGQRSGLADQLGGLNCLSADYDNDGDADILVLRGAWLQEAGQIRNSLLANDGAGVFTDVTRWAGLAEPAWPSQTAAWGDFDGDGLLDLYVGNESVVTGRDLPSQLFRNQGDGRFAEITDDAGVSNDRFCKGVGVGDYDNDGALDIYVSNLGPNRLYRNQGDGSFRDVAGPLQVTEPADRSFATWFFDYDNDGWLDVFVAAYDARIEDLAAWYLGEPDDATRPSLYRNLGDGRFEDVARSTGLDRPLQPMGANFGDLDNDGWLDVLLTTGNPHFETLMPNVMLRNDRAARFQDVTVSGGFGHL